MRPRAFLKLTGLLFLEAAVSAALFLRAYAEEPKAETQEMLLELPEAEAPDPGMERSLAPENRVDVDYVNGSTQAQNGIGMNFVYGFRNIAKSGRMLPFHTVITNYRDVPVEGRLVIEVPGSIETSTQDADEAKLRYSYDVVVQPNAWTQVEGLISVAEGAGKTMILFYGEDGELLYQEEKHIALGEENRSEILIGVISEQPELLGYLNNISLAGSGLKTRTIELDPGELPDSAAGLEQMDLLVLSNPNLDVFLDESIWMIHEWVENGGVLLIGTGTNGGAAELLGSELGSISIGMAEEKEVNMGLKYSKTGPDDAILSMPVSAVFAQNGIQVMQSDDIAMLTTIALGNGVIGITAYDLGDISGFCSAEPEYTDDLLRGLLGSARIAQYVHNADSGRSYYREADALVSMADPDRLPNAILFILFSACYIGFIGVGIYFFLRSHGLSVFYHVFVPAAAFMTGMLLWMCCSGMRNDGIRVDYAAMREYHEDSVTDTGFVKLSSGSRETYEIEVSGDYALYPLLKTANAPLEEDASEREGFFAEADAGEARSPQIDVRAFEDHTMIQTSDMKPFSGLLTEFTRRVAEDSTEAGGSAAAADLICELTYFDGHLSGHVENNSDQELADAAILMNGKTVLLGTIRAGERVDLAEAAIVSSPVGSGRAVADYVTGIDSFARESREYVRALRRSKLLRYYIDHTLTNSFSGARLVGFTEGKALMTGISADITTEQGGTMLLIATADAAFGRDGAVWTNGLKTEPKDIFGDYDATSNTTSGSCILEYSLGTELQVETLSFSSLDPVFETESLLAFNGMTAIYNYRTGAYDFLKIDDHPLTAEEVKPYLSPGNTITIRYTPDGVLKADQKVYLPVLDVIGKEK